MKAITLIPGTTTLRLVDRPEPEINAPDEVKLQVLEVGICGTDREEASGGRADAPPGSTELVIGHEMIGEVVQVGNAVTSVRPGDLGVFTVRRGCAHCRACAMNRSDMCYTGEYTERGIKGRDGYQAEFVVDKEQYLVSLPRQMAPFGVLTEPASVIEKAIDEACLVQVARLPDKATSTHWIEGKQVLIAGTGPIGILAALALRLRGANVFALGRKDPTSIEPTLLRKIGATYVDDREVKLDQLAKESGQMDLILDATGAARLEFSLLSILGMNGLYVLTGIPGGDRPFTIEGAALLREMVLRNQVMVGSVNASQKHFQMAIQDLRKSKESWGDTIDQLITHRFPYPQFTEAIINRPSDEIKAIVKWRKISEGQNG